MYHSVLQNGSTESAVLYHLHKPYPITLHSKRVQDSTIWEICILHCSKPSTFIYS